MSPPVSDSTAALWAQFAAPLRSFVAKRTPREVEPDDVLQDVFVRIQEQLPNLRDADRIDAWIFQIARNVVADAFRRRARWEPPTDGATVELAVPDADDDARAAERSLASCLVAMIDQLPEPYREAIKLTEIRGMKQSDAAQLVGISLSGMKSRVQRGRERLKGIIFDFCRVETDVRGAVMECDPVRADSLRPSSCSSDSMGMQSKTETNLTQTSDATTTAPAANACCGGPAPAGASACCALDAAVKATGGSGCGCGCGDEPAAVTKRGCC